MDDNVKRLNRLMSEGWSVVDIDSDDGAIEATLRRGPHTQRLHFDATDARRLLLLRPLRA